MSDNAFQKGDRVWSMACGWGSVISIGRPPDTYRLQVRFDQSSDDDDLCAYYTTDGRLQRHEARTLFFAEIPIPPEALVRPVKFERGEVVQWRGLSGQAKRTLLNAIRNPDTVSCAFADGSALVIDFNGPTLSLLKRERRLIRDIWKALDRFEEAGGEWE